ncbi:class I SAM-dependent methyltransferase [Streptomyces boncukensis]|uniref:Class I SAM-dependent methyltransferase n=1 Tax=Streptomyces boncukensis TaxID=2711219 RepID=A0A6G4WZP3_9ACTN|nr:class I SAM-dependent methyltransferase [Streptomyces boncukensis]NGO70756.1 class I SAM-dependent methyltransferase [Streptomyces boncukensis]
MAAEHNTDHEREVWDAYANSEHVRADVFDAEPVFRWTQYRGHGPGPELLGDPGSALEIGCGTGRAVAWLAQHGVKAVGVDLSPAMVGNIRAAWGTTGARFECAEVLGFLDGCGETFDAVYSNFGAAWFTDPRRLFPLVHRVLNPGGTFVFSQPPAIPGAYGPQGMYKGGFAGPARFTYRYSYEPHQWERFLLDAGFSHATAYVLDAPTEGHIGTLLVRATR